MRAEDAYAAIVDEARAGIARGDEPAWQELERRARAVGAGKADEDAALEQLRRLRAVHRARRLVAREPAPPPPQPAPRASYRVRPTIAANMDVRRQAPGVLAWDAVPAVAEWEVRISERASARDEYTVRETQTVPAGATTFELTLGPLPLRVHVLGRTSGGRLVRRAVISGLTEDTWNERWQRRASAA